MSGESSGAGADNEKAREKHGKRSGKPFSSSCTMSVRFPGPENIAEKTGLSVSLINEMYPTIEDLAIDITNVLDANLEPQYEAFPEPGQLPEMLKDLVRIRIDLYEETAFIKTYGEVSEHMFPSLREKRAVRDGRFRARIHGMLQPHFGAKTDEMAAKVEALVSWEFWRHMRNIQRLSEDQTRKIIGNLVQQVVRFP